MRKILYPLFTFPLWILYFISKLMPRNKDLVVFGTHTKSFSGNVKALFFHKDAPQYKKVFISNDLSLVRQLNDDKYIAYTKYSIQGIYHSLKAGTYIYSSYPSDINFWLSGGAKYINVWHGTPIKKIEQDVTTGKYALRNTYTWIFKILKPSLLAKPNVLLVSSKYEEKCFKSAFLVQDSSILRAFPPRLQKHIHHTEEQTLYHNILYVPTWRDDHSFLFSDYLDLQSFNHFLNQNKIMFYIKLHPSDNNLNIDAHFSHIISIHQSEDVYDYLHQADVLVSDYSSMVFESLYLSKPVVLFCPDYETYQKKSREFYIDPCKKLPVMISTTQKELENRLLTSINDKSIDHKKFYLFKPYEIEDKILKKLLLKAHSGI